MFKKSLLLILLLFGAVIAVFYLICNANAYDVKKVYWEIRYIDIYNTKTLYIYEYAVKKVNMVYDTATDMVIISGTDTPTMTISNGKIKVKPIKKEATMEP